MTDPIITRHLSEQGPASELNRDRAQVAGLGASNVQKLHNAPAGDLISREAAAFDAAMSIVFALLKNPDQADIMRHAADSLLENVTADRLRALKEPRA